VTATERPQPRQAVGNGHRVAARKDGGDGLRAVGLRKTYGDLVALADADLHVPRGAMLGFVGGNGAGKTTTMRIILGVLEADAGEVTMNGRPLDAAMRRRIGYMPAERGLYPKMQIGEQLEYLCRLHGMTVEQARSSVQRWLERLGLLERRDDPVEALSLGNQQKVQLAAALAHDPDVLVLDEPFSGLDPVAVKVMSEVLVERSREGVPVVFSSHQLELVEQLCDAVTIISRGRTVASGTVEELCSDGPLRVEVCSRYLQPNWAAPVPGAREVSLDSTGSVVELPSPGTVGDTELEVENLLAALLAAAAAFGPVTEFRRLRPSLTELFTEVVDP
jgi:ABC-2 type transport system ATP-binding protein